MYRELFAELKILAIFLVVGGLFLYGVFDTVYAFIK